MRHQYYHASIPPPTSSSPPPAPNSALANHRPSEAVARQGDEGATSPVSASHPSRPATLQQRQQMDNKQIHSEPQSEHASRSCCCCPAPDSSSSLAITDQANHQWQAKHDAPHHIERSLVSRQSAATLTSENIQQVVPTESAKSTTTTTVKRKSKSTHSARAQRQHQHQHIKRLPTKELLTAQPDTKQTTHNSSTPEPNTEQLAMTVKIKLEPQITPVNSDDEQDEDEQAITTTSTTTTTTTTGTNSSQRPLVEPVSFPESCDASKHDGHTFTQSQLLIDSDKAHQIDCHLVTPATPHGLRCEKVTEQQLDRLSSLIKIIRTGDFNEFSEMLEEKAFKKNLLNVFVDGHTALHYSLIYGRSLAWCKQLVLYGADPNLTNRAGWHPIHLAAFNGSRETMRYLIDCIAN